MFNLNLILRKKSTKSRLCEVFQNNVGGANVGGANVGGEND